MAQDVKSMQILSFSMVLGGGVPPCPPGLPRVFGPLWFIVILGHSPRITPHTCDNQTDWSFALIRGDAADGQSSNVLFVENLPAEAENFGRTVDGRSAVPSLCFFIASGPKRFEVVDANALCDAERVSSSFENLLARHCLMRWNSIALSCGAPKSSEIQNAAAVATGK